MKQIYLRITFLCFLLFFCKGVFAQYGGEMIGADIFLQAAHCELGIGHIAAYGTNTAPPSKFHPDVTYLGFVADCDEDGWSTGTPPYFGDYFIPGDPVEGWCIQVNGTRNDAYYQNYGFTSDYGSGGTTLTGANVSVTNDSNVMTACWQGTAYGGLSITQITVLDTNQMFWVATITLTNTTGSTMSGIYYMREFDPDQEEPWTGNFATTNTIDYTGPDSFLVSAVGWNYPPRSYVGLGTKYTNSRVFICNSGLLPSESEGLDAIYSGSAYDCTYSGTISEDVGIGLVMHLDDLAGGASESVKFTYIVKGGYYDTALVATGGAGWSVDGKVIADTVDTIAACTYGNDTNYVKLINAGAYTSWDWTPSTGLSTTTGTSNTIITDTSDGLITYTITGTPACGVAKKTFLLTISPGIPNPPPVSPLTYCIGLIAPPLTASGIGIMWYTTDIGGTGSSTPPTVSTSSLGSTTYYVSQTIAGCTSPRDSLTVNVISPPIITASSNSPVCSGGILSLIASDTITVATVTYSWGGPASFSSSLKDPDDTGITVSASGTYTLVGKAGGCTSASIIDVVVNPLPDITGDTFSNPYPCGGTNGTITLKGLTADAPYVVYYTDSVGGADSAYGVANSSGNIVLTGFGAGAYSDFSVMSTSGCISNVLPGPIRLTGPPLGAVTASNSSPVCADTSVLLSVTDTLSGTVSYLWSGPGSFSSTLQNPLIGSISALDAGTYSVVVGEDGCLSPIATTIVIVNPTPVISGTSITNPTTCGGTDGTITLSGLSASTAYTVYYSGKTSSETLSITSDGSGNVVIIGLSAGTYSGISVKLGCPSNVVGPIVLNDPATPVISGISNSGPVCAGASAGLSCTAGAGVSYSWSGPSGFLSSASAPVISTTIAADSGLYELTVSDSGCTSLPAYTDLIVYSQPATPTPGSNSPVCADSTLMLTATDIVSGASYSWSGPNSFSSGLQNPSLPDVSMFGGGIYTVTAIYHGCTSPAATLTVLVDSVPVITSVSHTDPTSCSGSDGSISLGGLSAGSVYAVSYTELTTSIVSLTANSSGEVVINGLSGGTYDNISVSGAEGCPSNIVGPVILKNPATPVVSSISDNGPLCAGDTLKLGCTTSPGVTYSWTGPSGSAFTSTLQSPVINTTIAADSGTYTLTVADSGCTSAPLSTDVVVYKVPAKPAANSNSPICSDSTLLLTATDITTGVSYSWAGPNFFVSGLQNPSIIGTLMAANGTYSVTATVGGCSSPAGTVNVIIDSTPFITVVSYANPSTCSGSDGSITIGGLTSGTTYSIDYKAGAASFTTSQTASVSGEVIITGLSSGKYSNITASSGSCLSNAVGVTLHDPALPVITAISNSGPVCAGSGLSLSCTSEPGASYSWTGPSFISTFQNPKIAVTTLSDTGLYSVTATDSGCTSLPKSTEVVIYAVPATPIAVSNSPVCADSTLVLSANDATSGVTYIWNGPLGYVSTDANPMLSSVTVDNAGTYYLIASNHGCTSPADSTFVIINPTPEIASFTYTNPTKCLGSDGTLTLNGPLAGTTYEVTYTFNGSPVSIVLTANSSGQVILTGLSSGKYDKIQVSAGGCPSNIVGPLTLQDPPPPAVPAISNNSPVCAGSTLIFNSGDTASGISFSWTGPGFAIADTASNPSISSATTVASGVYTLTVTKYNCHTSNSIEAIVNMTPPVPSANSNSPVCAGSTLTLRANSSPGCVYSWIGPSGFSEATLDTTVSIEIAESSAAGIYTVWATLAGCPSPTDSTEVFVTPLPPAPIVFDTGYCQNNTSAVALVATGSDLKWYATPYGGSPVPYEPPVPSTKVAGELVWYVSQTVSGCEGPRATQTVFITPQPAPPVVTPQTLCQVSGGSTLAEATGEDLLWYTPGDTSGSTVTPEVYLDSVKNYSWNVTQTVDGCTSYTSQETIVVKETPGVPITSSSPACSRHTVQLNATDTTANVTYLWSGPLGFTSTIESPSIANASASESGAYLVTATLNGCTSGADTLQVLVYPIPLFNIVASKPYVCQYDTITLAYSGPSFMNGGTYTWDYPLGTYYASGISSVFSFNSPGNYKISLSVYDNNIKQCPNADTTEVSVMPAPTGIIYIKPNICVGEVADVSLLNIEGEVVNYNWSFSPATAVDTPADPWDPQSLVWNDSGTYVVSLTVKTNMQCPSSVISDTVNIHALPLASIAPLSATMPVCDNDSVLFSPVDYVPGSQYRWNPAPFFNNNNAESTYGTIAFTGYVTLNVTNEWGCAASDSVMVTAEPCCQLAMPNAFAPNSDKSPEDRVFRPITIRNFMVHEFRIVNRWGQTVFETNNIANGWDGTFNGVPQDIGVYYYYLKYDCEGKTIEKSGDVTLVK